ncbi:MAG: hemolysin family protein [Deferribacteraceae bacterium]|jgi:CBS domain containing-hemolysin-like protein|nr:hemolysin family protein [Deferribacteraceae bacterium]
MLTVLLKLFTAFVLVGANAFFVLAEFSIVKIRKTRLEELVKKGNRTADHALDIVNRLDSYLSANQLGITLASLGLGWIGEPAIATIIQPILSKLPVYNTPLLHSVSVIIAFSFITLLHVVLGELVPKSIAIQKTEKVVLIIALPLKLFYKAAYPLIFIFDKIAILSLRIIGLSQGGGESQHSEEELRMIMNASTEGGVLDDTEGEMFDNLFAFSDKTAREVMIPRTDMLCLYLADGYEKNLNSVLNSSYTRFPLCRSDKDNIIGMVHLRDILGKEMTGAKGVNIETLKREILYVPESLNISAIMQKMKKSRIHLAVVVDEYGGTAGLISLEDILEEIVGEINDEHDTMREPEYKELPDGTFELSGLMHQDEAGKLLGIDFGEQEADSIGGFVFSLLGRKPVVGDTVIFGGYAFEVTEIERVRIIKVKAYKRL